MTEVHRPFGGDEVSLWLDENGVIMLKAVEPSGDAVELDAHQAVALADLLQRLAAQIARPSLCPNTVNRGLVGAACKPNGLS